MGVVYQLTFFFGLALLAIFITVFVFAVSLLGRAMETAAKVERNKVEERKQNNIKEMSDIRKEIQKAEKKGEIPKGLRRKLEKLEARNKEFDSELSKIRKAPQLLTVKGGVIHPCFFIILGLILISTASYLSTIKGFNTFIPLSIWVLGLSSLGYSIHRLYKSLKVIENVAITSEEAWITKTVEAFKIAQKELEEERRPELEFYFRGTVPPLHLNTESESSFTFGVGLLKGDIANNPTVYFLAPEGFEFVEAVKGPLSAGKYKGMVSVQYELKNIRKPHHRLFTVRLKAPSNPDTYTLLYELVCDGFDSKYKELEVVVEEDIPF